MWSYVHGSTAGFHLQTRDTDGGRVPLLREREGESEGWGMGHIRSDWSAGVEKWRGI